MSTSSKPRIALWDNARFLLIVLVVIGHLISTIRTDTALGYGLYAYVYLFHMPAMIVLAGMFSKPEASPKAVRSTLQLLITWGLWELIWAGIRAAVEGRAPGSSFLVSPAWTLWFLVSLATMRILLPYLARLRHPLLVSIGLALLAGMLPAIGTEFSASRTLAFLPFFVAGWLARERGWLTGAWFTRPALGTRIAAWGLLGGVALAFVCAPQLREFWRIDRWLTWRDDYFWLFSHAPIGNWQPTQWGEVVAGGILVAAALLALAAAMTLALLIVVPRGHSVATTWGTRTLFVYLLHGPIIYLLRESGVIAWFGELGGLGLLALVVGGVMLAIVLSMQWVSRATRMVIEPRFDGILVRDTTTQAPKAP
ncbi:fucose 4-O-acetylase-like acetyltransferase [Leucobacter luti]|uniref:Fucose 4-O-acetylase-like acetyltransferase n=1 Tax=Leucobacter luti TaxID=340320 RepID=A0A4R6RUU7_9MICO|nr:acyltransferase family protein [Leucobacter luti]TDP90700.1 fucose 4-O-acetylase-like acetyltransferase [Leucobacter luti]